MVASPLRKIVERPLPSCHAHLSEEFHPVLTRVYLARGIRHADELDRSLKRLPPPWMLSGNEFMADRLVEAVERQKHILIVADYDADGATACALAVAGLKSLGARHVDFIVPDRFRLGYGLTPQLVEAALSLEPEVLVTVDNGIASLAGVEAAKAIGLEVLITDHHLPGERLPDADAIVNPNLPDDPFPSKALAGVGVMFYVLSMLRSRLREGGWFERRGLEMPNLGRMLDLVALGTVADVVPLDTVNRILVHQGLLRIRAGYASPGLQALIEASGCTAEDLVAADLGFSLGPRLNAAGRLEDMSLGIRLLLAENLEQARPWAQKLEWLNRERRDIEAQMRDEALSYLAKQEWEREEAAGVCLFDPGWHEGVVGILASRIKDRLGKPVIAFAPGEVAGTLKGSARSIPGLHIRDVLGAVDTRHPGLITRYGGHAMAAGLMLRRQDLETFADAFAEQVDTCLTGQRRENVIHSDGCLMPDDFSMELAEQLRLGGPWGQGFPEPRFHGDFEVKRARIVGERHLKFSLRSQAGRSLDAIAFSLDEPSDWLACDRLRLAYQLDINEFRSRRDIQLKIDYLEAIQ